MKKIIILCTLSFIFILTNSSTISAIRLPYSHSLKRSCTQFITISKHMSRRIKTHISSHTKLYFLLSYPLQYGTIAAYFYGQPFVHKKNDQTWQECHNDGCKKIKEALLAGIKNTLTNFVGAGKAAHTLNDYRYFPK